MTWWFRKILQFSKTLYLKTIFFTTAKEILIEAHTFNYPNCFLWLLFSTTSYRLDCSWSPCLNVETSNASKFSVTNKQNDTIKIKTEKSVLLSGNICRIEYSPKFLSNNDLTVVSKAFGLPLTYNDDKTCVSILITPIINWDLS